MITAAVCTAVIFALNTLPSYASYNNKTLHDDKSGLTIKEEGRKITAYGNGEVVWKLEDNVLAQDFLLADIDHDKTDELLILCWKRGKYGRHRPTWVKHDTIMYSQHIFIYEIGQDTIRPKWMASDIGLKARSWEFSDGVLSITDTEDVVTKWVWISWGLEKL